MAPAPGRGAPDEPDASLIAAARQRDPQAWAGLYERFSGPLFGFFLHQVQDRPTAEDLTSEVFIEGLRAADRFQGDLADLRSWLFRIARNNLIDHFRRQRRSTVGSLDEAGESDLARANPSVDPSDAAIAAVERARVLDAVHSLSPDQREVILLRMAGGLTCAQIAGILGKTTGAVKALQHRGLSALAKTLSPQMEGTPGPGADGPRRGWEDQP